MVVLIRFRLIYCRVLIGEFRYFKIRSVNHTADVIADRRKPDLNVLVLLLPIQPFSQEKIDWEKQYSGDKNKMKNIWLEYKKHDQASRSNQLAHANSFN